MKIAFLFSAFCLFACHTAFSQQTEPEILKMTGEVGSTWKSIYKALQDVDTRYYKIQVVRKRNAETLGNAELSRLQVVSLFGERDAVFSTGNLIEVKARGTANREVEYIKLIWTTEAIDDIKDKVEEVNALLKKMNTTPTSQR